MREGKKIDFSLTKHQHELGGPGQVCVPFDLHDLNMGDVIGPCAQILSMTVRSRNLDPQKRNLLERRLAGDDSLDEAPRMTSEVDQSTGFEPRSNSGLGGGSRGAFRSPTSLGEAPEGAVPRTNGQADQ